MTATPSFSNVVERGFLRIPAGRVHYRFMEPASDRTPLYMAHAGPGCSRGLEPIIAQLGQTRRVIAPDMLGNGDSEPPAIPKTDIPYYVDCVIQVLDKLGVKTVDFYGDHTGAQIGVELAIQHPDRVRRLVLDGTPLFPPALKTDLLANYAKPVALQEYGGHLASVWGMVRDLALHFPYYKTDPAHRLNFSSVMPLEARHRLVLDILKSLQTYHLAYHAAFSHDTQGRLPLVGTPALLIAGHHDPLGEYLEAAAALLPGSRYLRLTYSEKAVAIRDFLED